MQSSLKQEREVEKYLEGIVPYIEILDELDNELLKGAVCQTRNSKIFCTFAFKMLSNNMNANTLTERGEKWQELMTLLDSRWSLTFDWVKTREGVVYEVPEDITLQGVEEVEYKRKEYFEGKHSLWNITLYLTLCLDIANKEKKITLLTEEHIEELANMVGSLMSFQEGLGLSGELLKGDELYTYLLRGISNDFGIQKTSVPAWRVNVAIAKDVEIAPSTYPLLIAGKNTQVITLKELPKYTSPAMFNVFLYMPFALRMIIKYNPYSKAETQKYLYKKKSEYKTSIFTFKAVLNSATRGGAIDEDEVDYSSLSGKDECQAALEHTEEENCNGGVYSFALVLASDDMKTLEEQTHKIEQVGLEKFLRLRVEKRNNAFAYFSSVLVAKSLAFNHGEYFLMTDNATDTIIKDGSNEREESKHLKEITGSSLPFLVAKKLEGSIFNFSPFGRDSEVGHTFLTGPTGAGKSIALSLMASSWLKYENTKVVYFDFGLSCLNVVESNGGKLFYPTVDKTTFCPFYKAKDNIDNIIAFVESIAIANKVPFTPEDRIAIKETAQVVDYGREDLDTFFGLLRPRLQKDGKESLLTQTLYQYISTLGNGIFNGKKDYFENPPRIIGIEMEKLLTGKATSLVYPTLTYLLNRVSDMFDPAKPVMVILDEAWKFLKDEFFASYIENWLRTLRKKNGMVVIATQEIDDLSKSAIASVILDSCTTRLFLANKRAKEPGNMKNYTKDEQGRGLGLEEEQVFIISSIPKFSMLLLQEEKTEVIDFACSVCMENLKSSDEMKKDFIKKAEGEDDLTKLAKV